MSIRSWESLLPGATLKRACERTGSQGDFQLWLCHQKDGLYEGKPEMTNCFQVSLQSWSGPIQLSFMAFLPHLWNDLDHEMGGGGAGSL